MSRGACSLHESHCAQVQSMNRDVLEAAVRVQALQRRRQNLVDTSERLRVRHCLTLCMPCTLALCTEWTVLWSLPCCSRTITWGSCSASMSKLSCLINRLLPKRVAWMSLTPLSILALILHLEPRPALDGLGS